MFDSNLIVFRIWYQTLVLSECYLMFVTIKCEMNGYLLRPPIEQIEIHELKSDALSLSSQKPILTAQVLWVNTRICRAKELSLSFLVTIYSITAGLMRCWRSRYERTYRCENKSIIRWRALNAFGFLRWTSSAFPDA